MDEWNDPSRTFALEELDRITQDMKELKANFNPEDLDESAQLSYRLFLENSQNTLDGAKWWYHGYDFEDAITALLTSVKPAYAALVTEMERQKEMTTTDDGVWKLPEGDAYYAHRLKMMTTTDMTATEIHELGLSEVDRIHGEMRDIMKTVEFDGTLQEFH